MSLTLNSLPRVDRLERAQVDLQVPQDLQAPQLSEVREDHKVQLALLVLQDLVGHVVKLGALDQAAALVKEDHQDLQVIYLTFYYFLLEKYVL